MENGLLQRCFGPSWRGKFAFREKCSNLQWSDWFLEQNRKRNKTFLSCFSYSMRKMSLMNKSRCHMSRIVCETGDRVHLLCCVMQMRFSMLHVKLESCKSGFPPNMTCDGVVCFSGLFRLSFRLLQCWLRLCQKHEFRSRYDGDVICILFWRKAPAESFAFPQMEKFCIPSVTTERNGLSIFSFEILSA